MMSFKLFYDVVKLKNIFCLANKNLKQSKFSQGRAPCYLVKSHNCVNPPYVLTIAMELITDWCLNSQSIFQEIKNEKVQINKVCDSSLQRYYVDKLIEHQACDRVLDEALEIIEKQLNSILRES